MFHDTSLRRTQKCHLSLGKIHAVRLTNLNTVRELRMHEGRKPNDLHEGFQRRLRGVG